MSDLLSRKQIHTFFSPQCQTVSFISDVKEHNGLIFPQISTASTTVQSEYFILLRIDYMKSLYLFKYQSAWIKKTTQKPNKQRLQVVRIVYFPAELRCGYSAATWNLPTHQYCMWSSISVYSKQIFNCFSSFIREREKKMIRIVCWTWKMKDEQLWNPREVRISG